MCIISAVSSLYSKNKVDSIYTDIYESLIKIEPIIPYNLENEMSKDYSEDFGVEKLPNDVFMRGCEFKEYFGIYRIYFRAISDGFNVILVKYGDRYNVYDERDIVAILRDFYNIAKERPDLITPDEMMSYLNGIIYPKDHWAIYGKRIEKLNVLVFCTKLRL